MKPSSLPLLLVLASCAAPKSPAPDHDADASGPDAVAGVVPEAAESGAFATVSLVRANGSRTTTTSADGSFRFEQVRPDTYRLFASTLDGHYALLDGVLPGGAPLVVSGLRPGGHLLVQPELDADARLAVLYEGERIADFTLRPLESESLVVPPGELELLLDSVPAVPPRVSVEVGARVSVAVTRGRD